METFEVGVNACFLHYDMAIGLWGPGSGMGHQREWHYLEMWPCFVGGSLSL